MLKNIISCGFALLAPLIMAHSQIPPVIIDNLPTQEVDTNYVNLEKGRFSIRTFAVFKSQSFRLLNNDYNLKYTPNNRLGIGVGIAYYPLLLDVAVNIKVYKEDASNRMDFQGELLTNMSLFSAYIQNYRGFNISGSQLSETEFRHDIHTFAAGISYFRVVNANKISLRSVLTGGAVQKKSMSSFALGGGINFNGLKADSSIVPYSQQYYFNDHAQITNMYGLTAGIKGGYVGVLVLPRGFFLFTTVFPGIGLSVKEVKSFDTFIPANLLNLELDFQFSFGYNGSKIYSTIGFVSHLSSSSLDYGNRINSNSGRIKWVLGFKI